MTFETVRLADRDLLGRRAPLDPSALVGEWLNTSSQGQGLARLWISPGSDGLTLEAEGVGSPAPVWRFDQSPRIYGGIGPVPEICGLTAEQARDDHRILLQGNLNLGLLVLCAFRSSLRGSGLRYFAREFYAPVEPASPAAGRPAGTPSAGGEIFADASIPESLDPSPMIGRWHNAERRARGIREIRIGARADGPLEIEVEGAGPHHWGIERVSTFACIDESGTPSLAGLAVYDFGFMESHLQLRVPSGVLAVAGFNVFKDGSGRPDYATREFFYR